MVRGGMQTVGFTGGLQEKPIAPGTLRGERSVNYFPITAYGNDIVFPTVSIAFEVDVLIDGATNITQ